MNAPIVQAPNWNFSFEIMCDTSDYAVGAVLGQRKEKKFHVIYYASRTLNEAQVKYATTEKELLAIVFAFDKVRLYQVSYKVIVHTDHAALKHLRTKKDAKPRLLRWMFLLENFVLKIKDKKRIENGIADHLSRLRIEDKIPINDSLPEEQLMALRIFESFLHTTKEIEAVETMEDKFPWYVDLVNYLSCEKEPPSLDAYQQKKFFRDVKDYYWDEPYLYRLCKDKLYRRCLLEEEINGLLTHCHRRTYEGHFATFKIVTKMLQAGFWWTTMFKDTHEFITKCDAC